MSPERLLGQPSRNGELQVSGRPSFKGQCGQQWALLPKIKEQTMVDFSLNSLSFCLVQDSGLGMVLPTGKVGLPSSINPT